MSDKATGCLLQVSVAPLSEQTLPTHPAYNTHVTGTRHARKQTTCAQTESQMADFTLVFPLFAHQLISHQEDTDLFLMLYLTRKV